MGFIKFMPVGPKEVVSLDTTNDAVRQIWQQLVQLRHMSRWSATFGTPTNYYLVDQAKTYFLDAVNSNWRSSGLLYYYSFLNLAKALLNSKGIFSEAAIRSSSILHGLSADPQQPMEIKDFKLKIWPKIVNGKSNVFAYLYETVTSDSWPFSGYEEVEVAAVLPYCEQIVAELSDFYAMQRAMVPTQSLLRTSQDNQHTWFEFVIPIQFAAVIATELQQFGFTVVNQTQFTPLDRDDWFRAYSKTNVTLNAMALIRSPVTPLVPQTQTSSTLASYANALHRLAVASPVYHHEQHWSFVPKITLHGQRLFWHPLLSDYLFSFILSSILRYYPHLLIYNQRDAFLSQAWCSQSAQNALRYFLLEFTDPSIVVRQV